MLRQSYPVKGWRRHQIPCEIHWFTCKRCQVKLRYVFAKEDDFLQLLQHYDRWLDRLKAEIRDGERKLEVYQLDGGQAVKHLAAIRETLIKLLKHLY